MFGSSAAYRDFEATALPHLPALHRSARRLLGDGADAEDVVQDVYLRAWRSFRSFERGTNCRAWLFRILFNCVTDRRKKRSREMVADDSEEILERQAATAPQWDRLTDAEILAALDALPDGMREVVVLADVEELSYKEIASVLEIRLGTVMSRLSRGRALLRTRLTESGTPRDIAEATR